ncbi:MAG TPA: hypothetical protein VFS97_03925 [Nitrososphaeraceae archaeon]|nr:hypothetical protein [Nitrososphaeraceae archaeon]
MNNKAILLATTTAFLAVSSFLMMGGVGIQTAEAGSSPGCNHKGDATTTIDPNAPNAVNTNTPTITPQPTV